MSSLSECVPLVSSLYRSRTGVLLALLFLGAPGYGAAVTEIYVNPAGRDTNPGTRAQPVATISRARDLVRPMAGKKPVVVQVADGTYYLPETLVFTPVDSGADGNAVVYRAEHEGGAVLSGGSRLELAWTPYRDGIFKAQTPHGVSMDQLFINGQSQRMARYPNYDAKQPTAAYQGFASDAFSRERATAWANPVGGYIHAMHRSRWGGYHYRITGKNADGKITYEGGWQNNRPSGMHNEFRMVENIFEELDAPGEWFHDAQTHTLYLCPEPGVDLAQAVVEVVRLRHLVEFQGSMKSPVRFIDLQGFVVRHAARTFMDTREPLLRSDWAMYRGGAILLTGTEDVRMLDIEFDQVGGNAVFVNNYNRDTIVQGCHIHDAGASGVCFVGDPEAVRNPLFAYGQKNDLGTIDRTPGPKTDNYPADGVVADCLIHGIGRVERQPAGIQISMARHITVRDCSIYDCARAGINISEGTWGGHLIQGCDVFDTVLETHDHGSFNSWGRDRYWRSDHLQASQQAVDTDPELPFLDAVDTTIIRDSRWRCDHGWDIDLDDGSSNYELYNNLMLQGGLKFREGFGRRAWNNITVNNGFHPHVWFNHSQDEVFNNIFMQAHRAIRVAYPGKRVDRNLFYATDPGIKDAGRKLGWDEHSVVADPLFVDPAKGDFRVRAGSPALELGFKNFPMDQFGVKKPALKAIAKTPAIPALELAGQATGSAASVSKPVSVPVYWLGAKLHGLVGEEFSAFGVSREAGGVALVEIPDDAIAVQAGLRKGDLVQGINGRAVKDEVVFLKVLAELGEAPLTLRLVRNQAEKTLMLHQSPYWVLESSDATDGFSHLPLPRSSDGRMSANRGTNNDPLTSLTDGRLSEGYGPVFSNGIHNGAYKMDLGSMMPVAAITSWSFNQNGNRGSQFVSLFGSRATDDPGWKTADPSQFTPLGTMDTTRLPGRTYRGVSLQARENQSLGSYRWIVWQVSPVTPKGENTAYQELHVTSGTVH